MKHMGLSRAQSRCLPEARVHLPIVWDQLFYLPPEFGLERAFALSSLGMIDDRRAPSDKSSPARELRRSEESMTEEGGERARAARESINCRSSPLQLEQQLPAALPPGQTDELGGAGPSFVRSGRPFPGHEVVRVRAGPLAIPQEAHRFNGMAPRVEIDHTHTHKLRHAGAPPAPDRSDGQ